MNPIQQKENQTPKDNKSQNRQDDKRQTKNSNPNNPNDPAYKNNQPYAGRKDA